MEESLLEYLCGARGMQTGSENGDEISEEGSGSLSDTAYFPAPHPHRVCVVRLDVTDELEMDHAHDDGPLSLTSVLAFGDCRETKKDA